MEEPLNPVHLAFQHQAADRLPKGELWLGTRLFAPLGLKDDLQGHISLRKRLDMDILCLPVSVESDYHDVQGYRYFTPDHLVQAGKDAPGLFHAAILDGPFQRMVDQLGLMKVLLDWRRNRKGLNEIYAAEASRVNALADACLETDVHAIVIADDIAASNGPYLNPTESGALFFPFFERMVSRIHGRKKYAMLHSCGNFTAYVPQLVQCGFNAFAACQCEHLNLAALKTSYGQEITFMTGIPGDLIQAESITAAMKTSLKGLVKMLAETGGFILATSTGLYNPGHINRLTQIYQMADRLGRRK
ncbi:MAG: hypothetical protein HKP58_00350 [Desulfatitalea sp.]|nr:hypothetical protein [Desulfatitalea sp.]NNJ98840.1 hypothetical protein [Desulfatitalea sp.]